MHSTIHAVCVGNKKGKTELKAMCDWYLKKKKKKFVERAGRHFGFFKRAGRHEKGAGRRALQKKPRQNTENSMTTDYQHSFLPKNLKLLFVNEIISSFM